MVREKINPKEVAKGFSHFIKDYGIITLAVGVVIGNATNDLVKALVDDLVTPFIGLISPQGHLQNLQFTVYHSVFKVGQAINALISFLIVALVVYIAAKSILKNEELLEKK